MEHENLVSWCDCSLASCKQSCSVCVAGKTQYAFCKQVNKNEFQIFVFLPAQKQSKHFELWIRAFPLHKRLRSMYLWNLSQVYWSKRLPIIQGFFFCFKHLPTSLKNLRIFIEVFCYKFWSMCHLYRHFVGVLRVFL